MAGAVDVAAELEVPGVLAHEVVGRVEEVDFPGKTTLDRGLDVGLGALAPTVVCARARPKAELDLWHSAASTRTCMLLPRSCVGGIGVPFAMSSARRVYFRASARKMWAPETGGAGLRRMACNDGLVAISRRAVFHTAGSSAHTSLREGARASATTKFFTPDMSLRGVTVGAGTA